MSLINNLKNPTLFSHPVEKFEVIETHISWVLLTGVYAYKIKKPVNFGFLDFSTLENRHLYCKEEVRLNSRLAPELYIDVVAIYGTEQTPSFYEDGVVIEYAVKMKQFPQEMEFDRLLYSHGLSNNIMLKLASKVAGFHQFIKKADKDSHFGDLAHIQQPVMENFQQIKKCIDEDKILTKLDYLSSWTERQCQALADFIESRKVNGYVRECHGDMHLRNIVLLDENIVIFDCIEFNENFYWIDVISEIAFLIMDLEVRDQHAFANQFLNHYLEITGDYYGLKLLRFYKVYRAMVRAKVDALRLKQEKPGTQEYIETLAQFRQYIDLACDYIHSQAPCLLINYGLSGSGKTYFTRTLLDKLPAIQVRSDVERKRLFHMEVQEHASTSFETFIYTKEASQRTYAHLLKIAQCLLTAGYSVVVDAANLKSETRQQFVELASLMCVPFFILSFTAPANVLRQRLITRESRGDDASDATLDILGHQLETYEPLTEEELRFSIEIDTTKDIDIAAIVNRIVEARN